MLLVSSTDWLSYLLVGSFFFLLMLVPILAWLAYSGLLTRANYVDDQPDTRILSLSASGELPPTELSTGDLEKIDLGARPDHAAAMRLYLLSDENPEAAPVREKRRRNRVITLLHEVMGEAHLPVQPVMEPRPAPVRSAASRVDESRRRRLEELLRKLGAM